MTDHLIREAIARMSGYVPGEQPTDPAVLKLNTNENPYPPSPRVAEALASLEDLFRLYPDPVCSSLREAIADLHGVEPGQVIVGNGSDEVLALCTRAFVEPYGSIGWLEPSYSLYPVIASIQDVEVRPVPLSDEFDWNMPDDYQADLFFLTNPNAPTGRSISCDVIRGFCSSFDGVVVIDEAYADFADEQCLELTALDNVIVMRTLSKSYSLAGLRAGYAVGSAPLVDALYKIKDSYNLNLITQVAAEAAIRDQDWMRSNVERIRTTRERVASALRERGWELEPSQTNFLWANPPGDARAMFETLRTKNILVRYFPGPVTGRHLRITVGTDEAMDRFLASL